MALFTPSESPAVVTREIDLTNGVPNVPTSTGAIVGNFRWGPCDEPTLINNEGTLARVFGTPDEDNSVDFHSAAYYLRYSDDLMVVRKITEVDEPGPAAVLSTSLTDTTTLINTGTAASITATHNTSSGQITGFTIVDSGDIYASAAPTITVNAPDSGDTPTVTAAVNNYGVTTVTVTPGAVPYFYDSTNPPALTVSGGDYYQTLNVTIVDNGGGYASAPNATIVGSPELGSAPSVATTIDADGNELATVTVTSNGNVYYGSTPTVTLSGGRAIYGVNAYDTTNSPTEVPIVKNDDSFESQRATLTSNGHTFVARYPGELGNSLKVSIVGAAGWSTWAYSGSFTGTPGTSSYADFKGATGDEVHVVVVDTEGEFTGVKGQILETFPFLSLARDAKDEQGGSTYIAEVINKTSNYVWLVDFPTALGNTAGSKTASGKSYSFTGEVNVTLTLGENSDTLSEDEYVTGFDLFEDVNTHLVDFLIAPGLANSTAQTTVVNDMVAIAQGIRKDCVVVTSPSRGAVVNNPVDAATDTLTDVTNFTRSSYLIVDNNYLKVYDKYNDQYIFIPACSSTAGLMAAADNNFAPWYSPAGPRRGQLLGVTSLAYTPNKSERDQLYLAGVNPIANIPGQGILLYGDKTHLARPSAFDRINVRRLFLVLERAISAAAGNILFEFNDEFTRAEFVNIVEPLLRDVKGRRGLTDFKVVCDETNNTGDVIDRNEFVASLFIKPARSINYITLNFVAVRTGVSFEEVVGNGNAGV